MRECQLTNEELIKKVRMWVDELCRTGGKGWSLQVPVNMERDPDVLISELCNRFEEIISAAGTLIQCNHDKYTKAISEPPFTMMCVTCGAKASSRRGPWIDAKRATRLEPVPVGEAQTVQRNCLQEADKIINGERQDMYGSPEDSFEIIAGYWNVFLREKIREACHKKGMDKVDIANLLSPLDTTNMMILFKQARKLGQRPCRDNYVDSCGYEAIGADRLMKEE